MVRMDTVVWWVKQYDGECKKVRGKDRYECRYENVRIQITPDKVKIGPLTDVNYTECWTYVEFDGRRSERDCFSAFIDIRDRTGIPVELRSEEFAEDQFWFIFDINDYRRALEFAKKLAEEDLWVDVRYASRVVFKKGERTLDLYEFIDTLEQLLK